MTAPLNAPAAGIVKWAAPRTLAGELEVFERDEIVATVQTGDGTVAVRAPSRGFIAAARAADGALVAERETIALYAGA